MPRSVRHTHPGRYYRDRYGFLYLRYRLGKGHFGTGWQRLTGFVGMPYFPIDPVEVPAMEAEVEVARWRDA